MHLYDHIIASRLLLARTQYYTTLQTGLLGDVLDIVYGESVLYTRCRLAVPVSLPFCHTVYLIVAHVLVYRSPQIAAQCENARGEALQEAYHTIEHGSAMISLSVNH